jgi:hypothetical protein
MFTLRPTKKPRHSTWKRKKWQSRQRLVYLCLTEPAKVWENPRRPQKKAKEAEDMTKALDNNIQATFLSGPQEGQVSYRDAKGATIAAAKKMFVFYANLLLVEVKYTWNKIVEGQMEGNLYIDLKGISQKGPRRMSRQLFDNCMRFHLLTVFPINAAEQEKDHITNVLKKPKRVNVYQFVQHVEQLNAYISQMRCFYNSLSFNSAIKPKNVPFI